MLAHRSDANPSQRLGQNDLLVAAAAAVKQHNGDAAAGYESDPGERESVRQRAEDENAREHAPEGEAVEEGRDCSGSAEPIGQQKPDVPQGDEQTGEAEKSEMPARRRPPASKPTDIAAATAITMTLVAKVTTMTGMRAGTPRPIRSRAAISTAEAKASRAADEIPSASGLGDQNAAGEAEYDEENARRPDPLSREGMRWPGSGTRAPSA